MSNTPPAVYILPSKHNGTLYVGVTGNLLRRAWEHRDDVADGRTCGRASRDAGFPRARG